MSQEKADPKIEEKKDSRSSDSFMFKGGVEIFPFEDLSHLAHGGLKACRARGKKGEDLFAVLCEKSLFPRTGAVSKYRSLQNLHMARVVASGVSDGSKHTRALLSEQKYIYVFENVYGMPLWTEGHSLTMNLRPELVRHTILPTIVTVLQDFKQSDFLHGSLHAGSLYAPMGVKDITKGDLSGIYVGECLSLPFSYAMPSLYLPISRASVPPIGRGRGVFEDEIYSLGILLAVLLRKTDPCEGFTETEILHAKINQGSYQAIVGDNRIDVYFLNALRGMLQDNSDQRWTLDDVAQWIDGQRIGSKQGGFKKLNANRPLSFNHKTYVRPEILAFDFQDNIAEAHQLITGGELEKWITRSIANPALKSHLQIALDNADKYGQKAGYMERKVAQVSLMLNSYSPVFYKETQFLPDGFGVSFGSALAQGEEISSYAEIMDMNLIPFWIEHQDKGAVDAAVMLASLEACRMSLKQSGIGYGLERCVYLLCDDAPCLSPTLSNYYVKTPEDYFWALDDMCLNKTMPERIIDRHVAAFLSVRDSQMIDAYMVDINAKIPHVRAMSILRMFATMQFRSKLEKAVGISNWVVDTLSQPLMERLHDRLLRQKVMVRLKKLANEGDIVAIAALFEKDTALRKDHEDYTMAMANYQELLQQEQVLDYNIEHNKRYGQGAGREVASIVSAALSFLIVLITLFVFFGDKLLGG